MIIHPTFNGEILKKYGILSKSHPWEARSTDDWQKTFGLVRCGIRREMEKYSYKIISLGLTCYVRWALSSWGLKPYKSEGEESYPFDLACYPISTIVRCIKTDFAEYLTPSYISQNRLTFHHDWYNIDFVHEKDLEGNPQLLIARYKRRINNFRKLYDTKQIIFFVMFNDTQNLITKNEYEELLSLLCQKQMNYRFIYLTPLEGNIPPYFDNINSFYRFCQLPDEQYKWQTKGCSETDLGIEFDLKNMEFVKNIIEKSFDYK